MRSDSLKVTQVVVEQEPRLPVSKSPVFPGTKYRAPAGVWAEQPGPVLLQTSRMQGLRLEGSQPVPTSAEQF